MDLQCEHPSRPHDIHRHGGGLIGPTTSAPRSRSEKPFRSATASFATWRKISLRWGCIASVSAFGKPGPDDKIDNDRQGLLVCVKIHDVDVPRLGDAQSCFEKLVLHLRSRLPGPSRLAWQGASRPPMTLRADARWPLAILDRRPTPRPGEGRSGRRDGLPARTKGHSDACRHLASALTHSVFKRGKKVGLAWFRICLVQQRNSHQGWAGMRRYRVAKYLSIFCSTPFLAHSCLNIG